MNDESFRKHYNISNHPSRPISPEVSPNSAPTRSNSVIDLSKIVSNDDLQPMKLKYSHTSEIPMHKINSRVNSQIFLRLGKGHFLNLTVPIPIFSGPTVDHVVHRKKVPPLIYQDTFPQCRIEVDPVLIP